MQFTLKNTPLEDIRVSLSKLPLEDVSLYNYLGFRIDNRLQLIICSTVSLANYIALLTFCLGYGPI